MINKLPTIVFHVNPDNYEELRKKVPHNAAFHDSEHPERPWDSHWLTNQLYLDAGIGPDIPDYIRRLAKKHGFSGFKSYPTGGSCINVAKGVSVYWEIDSYCDPERKERGYKFRELSFYIRRAKTLIGYNTCQYEYQQTSYVKDNQIYTLDSPTLSQHKKGKSTDLHFTDADVMFKEAFKYAESLKGDAAITKNSLRKQILHNIVMATIFDKVKKNVSFTIGDSIIQFDSTINPARANEDTCYVDVKFFVSSDGNALPQVAEILSNHGGLQFTMSSKSFSFRDSSLSWDSGFSRAIDLSDPSFDTDKLYLWTQDVLGQYFKTAVKVSELKCQIISLQQAGQNLSTADTKNFEMMFDANFAAITEQN